jgi:hypothetical protein
MGSAFKGWTQEVRWIFDTSRGPHTIRGIHYGSKPARRKGRVLAIRTKGGKRTPISRIRAVRNAAAKISQRLLKIEDRLFELREASQDGRLPLLERP